jgi:pseudoazurin
MEDQMLSSTTRLGLAGALAAAAGLAGLASPATAAAAPRVVKMLNHGAAGPMVFETAVLKIKPGETVTFAPTDMGHNAESIAGMVPAGAAPFKGPMSKPMTVTFTKPGVYGFKCLPHQGMGMVGLVVVGTPSNLAQAKAASATLPGRAKQVMAGLLASVR